MKKITDDFKRFLKKNYITIIILLAIYLLFNIQFNFSFYAPGGLINMNDRITSEDKIYNSEGTFNLTYVTLVRGTIPTYIISLFNHSWDKVENKEITYDGENLEDTMKLDRLLLEQSQSNAYEVAFKKANIDYKIEKIENYIIDIVEEADTDLKLFDNILKYDNIEYTSFEKMKDYISTKKVGDRVNFLVKRDKKEIECYANLIEIDGETKIGVASYEIKKLDSTPKIEVKSESKESGSSGGFMTALAIYNALTEEDITKGLTIAGTGTIDENGKVGIIGGVQYKLAGAYKKHADIFLVPKDNYKEAYDYKKKEKLDIELVSIDTFDEAIEYLSTLEG